MHALTPKTLFLAGVAGVVLAASGCASTDQPVQVASVDCKIAPLQTTSTTYGKKREVSPLERRQAEAHLANSDYRRAQLNSGLGQSGLIEEMLRDCQR